MLSSITVAPFSRIARPSASFFSLARRSSFALSQIGPQILQLAPMAA